MNISKKGILLFLVLFIWINISNCSPGYEIFVEHITGEVYPITIEPTDTVGDLKQKIASKVNTPAERQRLLFGSTELKDDKKTLKDYSVPEKAEITIVLRRL